MIGQRIINSTKIGNREQIEETPRRHKGNMSQSAKELGMSRQTV
ncbi:helix-turn-helix domain-containing protein [Megasphaera stantonii]